jgi:phenylacetate-CoA ligase
VELTPGQQNNVDTIRAKLIDQLRVRTNLGYNLEFHEYGTLPRYDVKANRFKDLRRKEQ